jgi:hypothetical protein
MDFYHDFRVHRFVVCWTPIHDFTGHAMPGVGIQGGHCFVQSPRS